MTPKPEGHMASYIRRRKFLVTLGGAAAWPLAARAQQGERMRRVGVLMPIADDSEGQERIKPFQLTLRDLGWVEGRNIQIDYRWTEGDANRIPRYVSELVMLRPDAIFETSSPVFRFRELSGNPARVDHCRSGATDSQRTSA